MPLHGLPNGLSVETIARITSRIYAGLLTLPGFVVHQPKLAIAGRRVTYSATVLGADQPYTYHLQFTLR